MAAAITLRTETGQQWALNRLMYFVEKATDAQVQVKSIEFVLPFHLRLHSLNVAKEGHFICSIQELDFNCLSPQLLKKQLVCSSIHVKGVKVGDVSTLFENPSSLPLPSPSSLSLPVDIYIKNLFIEDLSFEDQFITKQIDQPMLASLLKQTTWNIQGSLHHRARIDVTSIHLLLTAYDTTQTYLPTQLAIDMQNQRLSLSLHATQLPAQLFYPTLPQPLKMNMALYGQASLKTWQAFWQEPSHPSSEIKGNFKLHLFSTQTDPSLMTLLENETTIKGKYKLFDMGHIHLYDLLLDNSFLSMHGETHLLKDGKVQAGYFAGHFSQLEPLNLALSVPLKGTLNFQTNINGSLFAPILDLYIQSPFLEVQETPFEQIDAALLVNLESEKIQGNLQLSAQHKKLSYQIKTPFEWQQGVMINLPKVELLGADMQANGAFTFSVLQGLTGHLEGQAIQWDDWSVDYIRASCDSQKISSSNPFQIHASVELQGLKERKTALQASHFTLQTTQKVNLHPFNLSDLLIDSEGEDILWKEGQIQSCALKLQVDNPLQPTKGTASVFCKQLQVSEAKFDELAFESTINPTINVWPFKAQGSGEYKGKLVFLSDGYWKINEDSLEVEFSKLSGEFSSNPFHILQPFHLIRQQEKIEATSLHVLFGDSEFETDFTIDSQQLNGYFKGTNVDAALLHLVHPTLPVTGKASFLANFNGPLDHLQGHLKMVLHSIQINEKTLANPPLIDGTIEMKLTETGIYTTAILNGIGKTPILGEGFLPLILSIHPFNMDISKDSNLSFAFQAEGELDPYFQVFYNDTSNLAGQAKMTLIIQGTLNAPQVQGEIDLYDASYESMSTGALYKNIRARIEAEGSRLTLKDFSAEDNRGGIITATGRMQLDLKQQFPFELHISPSKIFIMNSDYATISASGPLILTGNKQQGKLKGTLSVDQGIIHMEAALPKQIKTLDMTFIDIIEGDSPTPNKKMPERQWPLALDLKIDIPGTVSIEGKSLQSTWKGRLAVTGTPQHPLLNGEMRIIHGNYSFNSKVFNLTQGNIHFAGPAGKKTSLYIVASKELGKIRAEIIAKGPTDKLALSFRSNPPLSQREILSYILFNRSISDITSDQGDRLAQSFIDLQSSTQEQSDFLSRFRNNIGIDRLDLASEKGTEDLSLQVGKYITDDIFISINKSLNAAGNRIDVEANLRKNLKAQAEIGLDDTETKVMLKWKKDY